MQKRLPVLPARGASHHLPRRHQGLVPAGRRVLEGPPLEDDDDLSTRADADRREHAATDVVDRALVQRLAVLEEPEVRHVPLAEGHADDVASAQRHGSPRSCRSGCIGALARRDGRACWGAHGELVELRIEQGPAQLSGHADAAWSRAGAHLADRNLPVRRVLLHVRVREGDSLPRDAEAPVPRPLGDLDLLALRAHLDPGDGVRLLVLVLLVRGSAASRAHRHGAGSWPRARLLNQKMA
mmetsp:Transcript_8463/g.17566  ORF Transcript_8463/g.17566 Transcript_8463/m.17566 type:complete len:240 (-) Transcript_8463:18-737(-)